MSYAPPDFSIDLTGQVALVTGASSGLGLRFAQVLAGAGAKVALAGRRADRLEALAGQIKAAGGIAYPLVMDVAQPEKFADAVTGIERELGLVTILVNNAGIVDGRLATKVPLEIIDSMMNTNIRAPYVLAREVALRLIKAKSPGRIVNIASMLAFHCSEPGSSLYAISKAAVVRMTEVLAVEWARYKINVNAIAPGAFASEMLDGMIGRIGTEFIEHYPRKRIGEPSGLDGTLLYLVSPSSEYVTGTCVKVDDGQLPR